MARYPEIVRIAHAIIAEGFSGRTIRPGHDHRRRSIWWYRERIAALGLDTWFHPSVEIFRRGAPEPLDGRHGHPAGRHALDRFRHHLSRPQHRHAAARLCPAPRRDARRRRGCAPAWPTPIACRTLLTASFRTGLSGNEILAAALAPRPRGGAARHHLLAPARLSRPWRRRLDRLLGQSDTPIRAASTACAPTPPGRSSSTPGARCPNGAGRRSSSGSRRTPFSTASAVRWLDGRQTASI